jgi:hypothetical protein
MKADLDDLREDKYNYTDQEYGKEATAICWHTGVKVMRYFALPIALDVAGICMLKKSHGMLKSNIAMLGTALNATTNDFRTYRKRVVDKEGKEADEYYRFGLKDEEVTETDSEGVERHRSVRVADPKNPGYSVYAKFFDDSCPRWSKDPIDNNAFLVQGQNIFNDILNTQGYVFLNDVYDYLGLPKTQIGQQVGWVKGLGDGYVDFGITDIYSVPDYAADAKRRFVNGYEPVILLDFNVDGYIIDKIGW